MPPHGRGRHNAGAVIAALLIAATVSGMVVALVAIGGGSSPASGAPAAGREVFLTGARENGRDPFSAALMTQIPAPAPMPSSTPAPGPPVTPAPPPQAAPPGSAGTRVSGSTIGLYGGTQRLSECDAKQLVAFQQANPDKARAWASVEGIDPASIPAYVGRLRQVVLRSDTRVTNHGYNAGQATTYQAVLQAGTAVMVDAFAVPRVRCACGNPLTPAAGASVPPVYTGSPWPSFQPSTVVVVVPPPRPVTVIVLVDPSGGTFGRGLPGDGSGDTAQPPTPPKPTLAPAATPAPSATPSASPSPSATPSPTATPVPGTPPPGVAGSYLLRFSLPSALGGVDQNDCRDAWLAAPSALVAVNVKDATVRIEAEGISLTGPIDGAGHFIASADVTADEPAYSAVLSGVLGSGRIVDAIYEVVTRDTKQGCDFPTVGERL